MKKTLLLWCFFSAFAVCVKADTSFSIPGDSALPRGDSLVPRCYWKNHLLAGASSGFGVYLGFGTGFGIKNWSLEGVASLQEENLEDFDRELAVLAGYRFLGTKKMYINFSMGAAWHKELSYRTIWYYDIYGNPVKAIGHMAEYHVETGAALKFDLLHRFSNKFALGMFATAFLGEHPAAGVGLNMMFGTKQ